MSVVELPALPPISKDSVYELLVSFFRGKETMLEKWIERNPGFIVRMELRPFLVVVYPPIRGSAYRSQHRVSDVCVRNILLYP